MKHELEPTLEGDRIRLRRVTLKDADSIAKYANNKTICTRVPMPYPYKKKHATYFIRRSHNNRKKGKEYQLGIEDKKTGEIIGMMGLMEISKVNKNLEVGYWLAKKYWGKGIAKEALNLILDFVFKKLKFQRIYAHVNGFNEQSRELLLSVGFKQEATLRNYLKWNGRWIDKWIIGMIKDDYLKLRKK